MGANITIVEDEVIIAFDLQSRIEALGHTVISSVTTGEGTLLALEKKRPDLILMDINLAGAMDGIECAEIIRSKWDVPIVFVTAHADSEQLARAKLVMPFGYLLKPIDDHSLRTTLEMALFVSKMDAESNRTGGTLRLNPDQEPMTLNGVNRHILFVDKDLRIRWANKTAAESVRLPQRDMVGHTCHTLWAHPEQPCKGCPAIDAIKTKAPVHARVVTFDGRTRGESAEPVFDTHGDVMGLLEIVEDIDDGSGHHDC